MRKTKILLSYLSICTLGLLTTCSRQDVKPPPKESSEPGTTMRETATRELPNIILFSIDTLRADHLGVFGYSKKTSPSIDAFGKEAVVFRKAISQAPTTAPAHMTIFTGLMPPVHQVPNMLKDGSIKALDRRIPTFVELLKQNGYFTAGFHGGGNIDGLFDFGRGFDIYSQDFIPQNWLGVHRSPEDLDVIRHWLQMSKARHRPLFLFLHHYICHGPYISAPQEYQSRFLAGNSVEGLPKKQSDKFSKAHKELDELRSGEAKLAAAMNVFYRMSQNFWRDVDLSRKDHRGHVIALYDSTVAYADYVFEKVLKILKSEGVYENSIIVLLSDHGEEFFEHGGREHGRLFIEQLHVPLIIKWPKDSGIGHREIERMVRTIDVFPTLMDSLEVPIGYPVQGVSMMPLLGRDGTYDPQIVSYDNRDYSKVRIVIDAMAYTNQYTPKVSKWLFDLETDAAEARNLADTRVSAVEQMEAVVRERLKTDRDFATKVRGFPAEPSFTEKRLLEQLMKLGYIESLPQ